MCLWREGREGGVEGGEDWLVRLVIFFSLKCSPLPEIEITVR